MERAVAEGERLVALHPNSTNGYPALADALASDGRPEEAVRVAEKGMRVDPAAHAWYAFFEARPYVDMGRYEEAVPLLQEHTAGMPDNLWGHVSLAVAYIELGRSQEAQAEVSAIRRISPHFSCHMLLRFEHSARWHDDGLCRKAGFN